MDLYHLSILELFLFQHLSWLNYFLHHLMEYISIHLEHPYYYFLKYFKLCNNNHDHSEYKILNIYHESIIYLELYLVKLINMLQFSYICFLLMGYDTILSELINR